MLEKILNISNDKNASDIHISSWNYVFIRNSRGEIESLENFWETSKEEAKKIVLEIIWDNNFKDFEKNMEIDISYSLDEERKYRVNCFKNTNWYSIAMRKIIKEIPTMQELWLWDNIKESLDKQKWLIVVTGPTWSGKSTILASMIDYINSNHKKHIITIEDPVEFSFSSKKSLINQREIWNSTKSFENAIKSAMREDPDVIVIWEMRDPETIKSALTLAETGHLVISTLHTNDSVQSIDRIVDIFPSATQRQIRMQLWLCLNSVISQRLLPQKNENKRIPAREILINNDAVKNLILTWKTHQLYSVLEVWESKWMILMDKYLIALYKKNLISEETLLNFARDKDTINTFLQ